jgi:hypothetical protein
VGDALRGTIDMQMTLTASTGARIQVWREDDVFHARRALTAETPQTCLAVDLFEVIADLAGLDLDRDAQAGEAIELAVSAQRRLGGGHTEEGHSAEDSGSGYGSR